MNDLDTKTFSKVNISKLIKDVDETAFISQLSAAGLTPHHTRRNEIRFKQSSGLSLFLDRKTGVWRIYNHSGKIDVPGGNIWHFTTQLHKIQLRTPDDFIHVLNVICKHAGLNPDRYLIESVKHQGSAREARGKRQGSTKKRKTVVYQHRTNIAPVSYQSGTSSKKYDHKFAEWQSEQGRAVLQYWNKRGVSLEYLQRYNIRPLAEARHIEKGYKTRFNSIDFAFAYIVPDDAGTIKYKRPNAIKDKNGHIQRGVGTYVFGLDQLPDNCEMIIIAAGESDTMVLNQHFNEYNVYAVCFSSETAPIDPDILQALRSKAKHVVCLFDNDFKINKQTKTGTGEMFMRKNAIEHGLPFIRIADFVNDPERCPGVYQAGINKTLNDVCDIYQKAGLSLLRKIIAKAYRHTDGRNDQHRIIYNQYLSESLDQFKAVILKHDRINLKAATGAGKTSACIKLAYDPEFMQKISAKRFILAVPTIAIGEQLSADIRREYGHEVPFVAGINQDAQNQDSAVYIATFDSLHKIDDIIHESVLIVDESHLMAEAFGYRPEACIQVYQCLNQSIKTLLISATPHEYAGFINITACGGNTQKLYIRPVYYTGKKIDIDIQAPKAGRVTIVQINDINQLKALQSKCERSGISATIISSKENGTYTESNIHYQELISTGTTSAQIILCTNLLDIGLSIKQPIDTVHCFNAESFRKLLQLIARGRMDGMINSEINAFSYHKRKPDFESLIHQHQAGRYCQYEYVFDKMYKAAENLAFALNGYTPAFKDEYNPKGISDFKAIIFDERHRRHIVNEAAVHHLAYSEYHSEISNEQFYQDAKEMNPNAVILEPIEMEFTIDQQAHLDAKELSQESKDLKKLAFDVFALNPDACLEAIYLKTNNGKLKKHIRQHIIIDRTISAHAEAIYQAHQELFDAGYIETPAKRFIEIKTITGDADLSNKVVFAHQDLPGYQTKYNAILIAYKSESKDAKAIHHQNTIKAIYQAHRNTGKSEYTFHQLKQLLIKAGIDKDNLKDAKRVLLWIGQIWKYDKQRKTTDGHKFTIYQIGNKWTKAALIESANSCFDIAVKESLQNIEIQSNKPVKGDTEKHYNTKRNNDFARPGSAPF